MRMSFQLHMWCATPPQLPVSPSGKFKLLVKLHDRLALSKLTRHCCQHHAASKLGTACDLGSNTQLAASSFTALQHVGTTLVVCHHVRRAHRVPGGTPATGVPPATRGWVFARKRKHERRQCRDHLACSTVSVMGVTLLCMAK